MKETAECHDVFKGGEELEAGVQVDTNAFGMMKGFYTPCVIRIYATAKEERRLAMIGFED